MNRLRYSCVTTLFAAVCMANSASPVDAKATATELTEAVVQAKSLTGEPKISVIGPEATVVTYKTDKSIAKDLKIDAVMTAKAIFDKDPELTKVILHFHDPRITANYSEVPVTVADVGAFGAGAISKDQLLNVMPIVEHSTAGGAKPAPMARPIVAASGVVPGHFSNVNYGVQFDYPTRWVADYHINGNALIRLFFAGVRSRSMIELRVYPLKPNPFVILNQPPNELFLPTWNAALADTIPEYKQFSEKFANALTHMTPITTTPVAIQKTIGLGPHKAIKGVQIALWAKMKYSDRHYMRCVVFNGKRYTYQLTMLTSEEEASNSSADFDSVLNSLQIN